MPGSPANTTAGIIYLLSATDLLVKGDLDLEGHIDYSVETGITAGTNQIQGQVPLTKTINGVSVCANDFDVVTCPAHSAGRLLLIKNNGAKELQIFPALGDDVAGGTDVSRLLSPNESVTLIGVDTGKWEILATTEQLHAEMHDTDNTDVFTIHSEDQHHVYHSNGLVGGHLDGFTFDAGGAGVTFTVSSVGDNGGGTILCTTSAPHGLDVGSIVGQSNFANPAYDGVFTVLTVPSTTTYTVTAVFGATGTGDCDEPATLIALTGSSGHYAVSWQASAVLEGNNDTFDFQMCAGDVAVPETKARRKFGTAGDFGHTSGNGIITLVEGERFSWGFTNTSGITNITIRNLSISLIRL